MWLEGTLLRNGPGVFDVPTGDRSRYALDHWFDGLAVLHRFTIAGESVYYGNPHLAPGLERRIADRAMPTTSR